MKRTSIKRFAAAAVSGALMLGMGAAAGYAAAVPREGIAAEENTAVWQHQESGRAVSGDFEYETTAINGRIARYMGSGEAAVIPEQIDGMPVAGIAQDAFRDCSGLKSVTIPNSVDSIGESAFAGCSSLQTVLLPSGRRAIFKEAFAGCSSLTDVISPSANIVNVYEGAFRSCTSLKRLLLINWVHSGAEHLRRCSARGAVHSCRRCSGNGSLHPVQSADLLAAFDPAPATVQFGYRPSDDWEQDSTYTGLPISTRSSSFTVSDMIRMFRPTAQAA